MIISPLYIDLTAKKRRSLNLNFYRNAHFQELNKMKKMYKQAVKEQIQQIVRITWPIKVRYRYYLQRKSDVGNVHAVVEKFFLDALVELSRLPDDNVEFVIGGDYQFVGYDRKSPRVEIEIMENYQE